MLSITERPDPLARLLTASEAIASLRDIFAAEEPINDVLTRVVNTTVNAIPDADAVTITVLSGQAPRTAAYTDSAVLTLDRQQYATGQGPCLLAADSRRTVRVEMDHQPSRWPQFISAARQQGVRASLSAPLLADAPEQNGNEQLVGSLNIYSRSACAFDSFDEAIISLYTIAASQAITNARRWQHARETVTQLEQALTSRTDIDQAKGVLRALHGYTADQAFDALVRQSQRRNIKLHTIARELLASLATASPDENNDIQLGKSRTTTKTATAL